MRPIPSDKLYKSVVGYAIGDAYGVPFEMEQKFHARFDNTAQIMKGFGTHNQPAGTWSDDTSLVLATLDVLATCNSMVDIGSGKISDEFFGKLMCAFNNWRNWGTYGCLTQCFDVGLTTDSAIREFVLNKDIDQCGRTGEADCGNGSLMRMLPIGFLSQSLTMEQRYQWCSQLSALTHANPLNFICCFIYVDLVVGLISGLAFEKAYEQTKKSVDKLNQQGCLRSFDLDKLNRILGSGFSDLPIDEIHGRTFVVHTLEAVIWAILNGKDYKSTIVLAVTLGHDTDTVAALAGGLCGLIYENPLPDMWMKQLQNVDLIMNISSKFVSAYPSIFNNK